jgi:nondiscriminating glutamyl-tRNA synthetase
MSNNEIRVRIAPSPTGYLHVGTARTAIFNWLFARHNNGKFVIRIEDTDPTRSKPELIGPIFDSFKWLGLDWDEEPLFQSTRMENYMPYIEKLLETEVAYQCFCTSDELDAARKKAMAEKKPFGYGGKCRRLSVSDIKDCLDDGKKCAIRLKIPEGETSYDDLLLGNITRQNSEIEDFVICRGDGRAVYNLAVVVDDHEMGITHVIRGNDHISNTFKQIHIYNALGLTLPKFGHVPLILQKDRKKLSKRRGAKDVAEYGSEGILPEALFNFLCLLGWSPKDDREFLSQEELIKIFELKNVSASNPIFDEDKLLALNGEYIRNMPDHKLAALVAPLLVQAELQSKYWLETRWEYLMKVVALLKERCRRTTDFVTLGVYFFNSEYEYDAKAEKKQFTPENKEYLLKLKESFDKLDNFNKENLEAALDGVAESLDINRATLIHPTRLAVSGLSGGPGLFDILETIGIDQTISRLDRAIKHIENMEA